VERAASFRKEMGGDLGGVGGTVANDDGFARIRSENDVRRVVWIVDGKGGGGQMAGIGKELLVVMKKLGV
jgi:hypothetical protein